jgi:ferritin
MSKHFSLSELQTWDRFTRANFINSLSGFKSLSLIGTVNDKGVSNLAVFSNIVHLGADPALIGFINRPLSAAPHTIQNIQDPKEKLTKIITLFTQSLPESVGKLDYNKSFLNQIVLSESSKVYLIKEVKEINSYQVFKPYKDLCNKISEVMLSLNPTYAYARSLSSTLIETAHSQQYFSKNLPRLTDVANQKEEEFVFNFLSQLVFSALKPV